MPKLVNLNILSIIHIIFGSTPAFELKFVINIGTSAVDWWLTNTNVRSLRHNRISSPTSTTKKQILKNLTYLKNKIQFFRSPGYSFFFCSETCLAEHPYRVI